MPPRAKNAVAFNCGISNQDGRTRYDCEGSSPTNAPTIHAQSCAYRLRAAHGFWLPKFAISSNRFIRPTNLSSGRVGGCAGHPGLAGCSAGDGASGNCAARNHCPGRQRSCAPSRDRRTDTGIAQRAADRVDAITRERRRLCNARWS